jgi:hypothetical protein
MQILETISRQRGGHPRYIPKGGGFRQLAPPGVDGPICIVYFGLQSLAASRVRSLLGRASGVTHLPKQVGVAEVKQMKNAQPFERLQQPLQIKRLRKWT